MALAVATHSHLEPIFRKDPPQAVAQDFISNFPIYRYGLDDDGIYTEEGAFHFPNMELYVEQLRSLYLQSRFTSHNVTCTQTERKIEWTIVYKREMPVYRRINNFVETRFRSYEGTQKITFLLEDGSYKMSCLEVSEITFSNSRANQRITG